MRLFDKIKQHLTPPKYRYQAQRLALQSQCAGLLDSKQMMTVLNTRWPDLDTPLSELPMLSVDFETTGLDPIKDKLLSVGYVGLQGTNIRLSDAYHNVIKAKNTLTNENVCIHSITEQEMADGLPLEQVVNDLLGALPGKVMLVHFNRIERGFLSEACWQLYGIRPHFPMVDTLDIAHRWLTKKGYALCAHDFSLVQLRKRFGLPMHHSHNALSDAIATSELYLALMAERDVQLLTLRDVIV